MPNWTDAQYAAFMARQMTPDSPIIRPLTPALDHESDLHDHILTYCRAKGWLAVHSRMDKRTTYAVGTSDFIIVTPKTVLFIECKRRGAKMTTEQLAFRAQILKLGWPHAVVHNMDEFIEALRASSIQSGIVSTPHHDASV